MRSNQVTATCSHTNYYYTPGHTKKAVCPGCGKEYTYSGETYRYPYKKLYFCSYTCRTQYLRGVAKIN